MSVIDTLITDRTLADVAIKNAKGKYDWADYNRVQEAVSYIASRFREYGYRLSITALPIWSREMYPSKAQLDVYIANVRALRGTITVAATTPSCPASMNFLDYVKANNIEQILVDLEDSLNRYLLSQVACGAAECGGDYF